VRHNYDPPKKFMPVPQHGRPLIKNTFTMVDSSDSEYEDEDGHFDDTTVYNLRNRSIEDAGEEGCTNSSRKASYEGLKPRLASQSVKSVAKSLEHVAKRLKSAPYDKNTSNRIIHAAYTMQLQYLRAKQKNTKGEKPPPKPRIRERVCELFGLSSRTYGKIMNAYLAEQEGRQIVETYQTGDKGNYRCKETRIPQAGAAVVAIREFVREERAN
jgi:hypothetical protein